MVYYYITTIDAFLQNIWSGFKYHNIQIGNFVFLTGFLSAKFVQYASISLICNVGIQY